MRKLKLNVEQLQVESFSVLRDRRRTGTVAAREVDTDYCYTMDDACFFDGGGAYTVGTCIGPTYCCPMTWKQTCNSCPYTCNADTCGGATCPDTCGISCEPNNPCP